MSFYDDDDDDMIGFGDDEGDFDEEFDDDDDGVDQEQQDQEEQAQQQVFEPTFADMSRMGGVMSGETDKQKEYNMRLKEALDNQELSDIYYNIIVRYPGYMYLNPNLLANVLNIYSNLDETKNPDKQILRKKIESLAKKSRGEYSESDIFRYWRIITKKL